MPVLDTQESYCLSVVENPFSLEREIHTAPEGVTLYESLSTTYDGFEYFSVWLNGERIPRERWSFVYPQKGDVVAARMIPGNSGGGSGKNVATLVVGVVLIAAAVATAGAGFSGFGLIGTSLSVSTGQIALAGAALSLAGINGLVNPISSPGISDTGQDADSSFALNARKNVPNRYGLIPKIFGTIRTFPPMGIQPYTEIKGDDQFLTMLFIPGYGPLELDQAEMKIGETLFNNIPDAEIEIREGTPSDAALTLVPRTVIEQNPNSTLSNAAGYITHTTESAINEISVDLGLLRGAVEFITSNSTGKLKRFPVIVHFDIEYSVAGAGSWIVAPSSGSEVLVSNIGNVFRTQGTGGRIQVDSARHGFVAGDTVALAGIQDANPTGPSVLNGNSYSVLDAAADVFTLDAFAATEGWDALGTHQVSTGTATKSVSGFFIRDNTTAAIRRNFSWPVTNGPAYDVRIRRITADPTSDSQQIADTVTWTALRSIRDTSPIADQNTAKIAIRFKANEVINGVVENFSCLAKAKYQVYNGSSWSLAQSNSPAWAYANVLTGNAIARPLGLSRIDADGLKAFADVCATEGQEFNAEIRRQRTVKAMLQTIAAAGRAAMYIKDASLYSIVQDIQQTIVKGHFSERNSYDYEGYKVFVKAPHALRIQFFNELKDYQPDERFVYDDGFDENNSTEFESMRFEGLTHPDQIWKEGRFHLAQIKLRAEQYSIKVDVEQLANTKGDLIRFQNKAALLGGGTGRLSSVSGSTVVLDTPITMEGGNSYAIRARKSDSESTLIDVVLNVGEQTTITTTGSWDNGAPSAGDWFGFGIQGIETIEGIIKDILPFDGVHAKILFIDHAPGVYQAPTGTIPPFNSNISLPPGSDFLPVPQVLSLRSDEIALFRGSSGDLIPQILVKLGLASTVPRRGLKFEGRIRFVGQPNTTSYIDILEVSAASGELAFRNVSQGDTYSLQFRTISSDGERSSLWTTAVTHEVIGKASLPPDVTNFEVTVQAGGAREYSWTLANKPIDLLGFRIRYELGTGGTWDTGTDLLNYDESGFIVASPFENNLLAPGTYTFSIKAVDTSRNESSAAQIIERTLTSGPTIFDDGTAPATPTGLSLTAGGVLSNDGTYTSKIDADWADNAEGDLKGYSVEFKKTGETVFQSRSVFNKSNEQFLGLENNTQYECRVAAFDKGGNESAFTAWETATTPTDPGAPSQVTGLVAVGFIFYIGLSWNVHTDSFVKEFEVEGADDSNFMVNVTTTRVQGTAVSINVDAGVQRYFRVRAISKTNAQGNWSATVEATTVGIDQSDIANLEIKIGDLNTNVQNLISTSSDSFIVNGAGEQGDVGSVPTGWSIVGTNFLIADDQKRLGSRSIKITHGSDLQSFATQTMTLKYGEVYTMEGWIRTDTLNGTGDDGVVFKVSAVPAFDFGFAYGDVSGDFDSGNTEPEIGVHTPGTGGEWFFVKRQFIPIAPGGSSNGDDADCQFTIVMGSDGVITGSAWFDGVRLYRDILITTDVIATGAVTADGIAANTIVANNLVKTAALITETAQIGNAKIINSHIDNLAVSEAKINNLQVTTIKIAANAASETGSSTAAGPINLTTDENFTDLINFVYNAEGVGSATVFGRFNLEQFGGNQVTKVTVELRAGTTVLDTYSNQYGFSVPKLIVLYGTHNPVSGNITYNIRAKYEDVPPGGAPDQCKGRDMYLLVKENLK